MSNCLISKNITRRDFFKKASGGIVASYLASLGPAKKALVATLNDIFWIKNIPDLPFYGPGLGHNHIGLDSLLFLMGSQGLKFYRSSQESPLSGPGGLIAPDDVVLIKVNGQWKYRGATNSDVIRGLIQRILDHPDVFTGEVVIIENGQGRGSLNCDTSAAYSGDHGVHANANDERHSFLYLVNSIFGDPRVSAYLLDPIAHKFIEASDHVTDGYRTYENVSYPCFTTTGGHRVELREGIWRSGSHTPNLKLINVPVLKHHDTGGSEITISLKHFYGIVSMQDGQSGFRHYHGLGETCGKMMASVATPVLSIVDAIWVSHSSLTGYPEQTTFRANQLMASQDPVALDYYAAKYILYPIDSNYRHHPDFSGIDHWLVQARDTINSRGGLMNPSKGILVDRVTRNESEIRAFVSDAGQNIRSALISLSATSLKFFALTLAPRIQEKSLEIINAGSGQFAWRVEGDAGWLTCNPASGSGNARVNVIVDPSGLLPGIYEGTLSVSSPDAFNSPQKVTIFLTVRESKKKNSSRRRINPRNSED